MKIWKMQVEKISFVINHQVILYLQDDEERIEDHEMDEDLDYGNNYFDNGEGYNDEDDNLDEGDGPIYQHLAELSKPSKSFLN